MIRDGNNVLILLTYYVNDGEIQCPLLMESPTKGQSTIDINSTIRKNTTILPNILEAHTLTRGDTGTSLNVVVKATVIKKLTGEHYNLTLIEDCSLITDDYPNMFQQAIGFVLSCYGQSQASTLTDARKRSWISKIAKVIDKPNKLCSVPLSTQAFEENVLWAHLPAAVWKHA